MQPLGSDTHEKSGTRTPGKKIIIQAGIVIAGSGRTAAVAAVDIARRYARGTEWQIWCFFTRSTNNKAATKSIIS